MHTSMHAYIHMGDYHQPLSLRLPPNPHYRRYRLTTYVHAYIHMGDYHQPISLRLPPNPHYRRYRLTTCMHAYIHLGDYHQPLSLRLPPNPFITGAIDSLHTCMHTYIWVTTTNPFHYDFHQTLSLPALSTHYIHACIHAYG